MLRSGSIPSFCYPLCPVGLIIDIAGDLRLGIDQRTDLAGGGVGKRGDAGKAIGLRFFSV